MELPRQSSSIFISAAGERISRLFFNDLADTWDLELDGSSRVWWLSKPQAPELCKVEACETRKLKIAGSELRG